MSRNQILKQKKLTIGMDLGDRSTRYCVLDEAGEVILERSVPTTKKALDQVFGAIPRSRVALETGTAVWKRMKLSEEAPKTVRTKS